jgi:group II intron reverse transcriptase/maturase
VLQRAVLRVLDDYYETCFLECSYGYRPGRGLRQAVAAIIDHRERGLEWVLDGDVDECFDSIDHGLLTDFLEADIHDPIILRLIGQWLAVGRLDPDVARGIPLGNVISPLLCNVYLHHLDEDLVWAGLTPVRYADDFCVFCATEREVQRAWQEAAASLGRLKLQLEPTKTEIAHFDQGFDYLGITFTGTPIALSPTTSGSR